MSTFLLTWKPPHWEWNDLSELAACSKKGEPIETRWTSGNRKNIFREDRVFLLRQGLDKPGVVASGWVSKDCYKARHWKEELRAQGKMALFVKVDWDILLTVDECLSRERLLEGGVPVALLNSRSGGVEIEATMAQNLECLWANHLHLEAPIANLAQGTVRRWEGLPIEHTGYRGSRDRRLRNQVLDDSKGICAACDTDFSKKLQGKGLRVLQVHHVKQVGSGDKPRLSKPSDLVVVCANCHMLIHMNPRKALTISQLRTLLNSK